MVCCHCRDHQNTAGMLFYIILLSMFQKLFCVFFFLLNIIRCIYVNCTGFTRSHWRHLYYSNLFCKVILQSNEDLLCIYLSTTESICNIIHLKVTIFFHSKLSDSIQYFIWAKQQFFNRKWWISTPLTINWLLFIING